MSPRRLISRGREMVTSWALVLTVVATVGAGVSLATGLLAIQHERADSIRRACIEQNARHDATVATLDRLLAERMNEVPPARRAQLRDSRRFTVLLIDALAPKRDCSARVAESVSR